MIKSKDISVVVQGAINKELTPKCLKSIRKFLPDAEIILSTWKGSDIKELDYDIIVLNKDPGGIRHDYAVWNKPYSMNNFNRQLTSTKNGIQKATKKYILKLRTDLVLKSVRFLEYWDKFLERNKEYSIFNHRMLVSTIYSKEYAGNGGTGNPLPFHPSDFWFFGERNDIMDYFGDCPMQTREEAGNWKFKYPNRCPYFSPILRYAPEQQFCYHWAKKYFPDIQFEDWSDWNEENIELSNNILYNNFIFLGYLQSGIFSKKHALSINNEDLIQGLISYKHFLEQYKKYCDKDFSVEKEVLKISKIHTWKDDLHLPKYVNKLQKHWERFVTPFKIVFNSIFGFVSVVFYILHIIFNLVIFTPRFIYKSFNK